jgi:hypothetical protein
MDTRMDEALGILKDTGPEFAHGFSNHGPMAVEAMVALGHEDRALSWAKQYRRRLPGRPAGREPIPPDRWETALGDIERYGDWVVFFRRELGGATWQAVLRRWTPRLAPGIVAAACHGVIRTGHAVRSLSRGETEIRRLELAEGLAYWASRYQPLPGIPVHQTSGLRPSAAVSRIELLPSDRRLYRTLISEKVKKLEGFLPFEKVVNLVDTPTEASLFLLDMTSAFVRIYLANARDAGSAITFIHTVTGPGAVHLMAPHLSGETVGLLLRFAWQASAAIYAAIGQRRQPDALEDRDINRRALAERAVKTGDEHAIKFAEVCLRLYGINPDPAYLIASEHASQLLTRDRA